MKYTNMPCYIYMIGEDAVSRSGHRYIKVGYASNVEVRLKGLQTGNPRKLVIHKKLWVHDGLFAEARCHQKLKKFKAVGEWFLLSQKQFESLLEDQWWKTTCQQYLQYSKIEETAEYILRPVYTSLS